MIGIALAGCAVEPSTDPGYLRLRGDVAPGVVLKGADAGAMLVWVTVADGQTCVEADQVPFVPELLRYEADVQGPPALDGEPCVPTPADFEEPGPFAVGVLALIDPDKGHPLSVTADPVSLLGWFAGDPGDVGPLLSADHGRVAAVASAYTLMVADHPLELGEPYCRFEGVIQGLVLYDDRGADCGGWAPLSEPGERTEYQGVDLLTP